VNALPDTALSADFSPSAAQSDRRYRPLLVASAVIWLAAVCGGLAYLADYAYQPGVPAAIPVDWPVQSTIKLAPDKATLIMLAHPQCPCTRASMGELAAVMAHTQGRVNAYVFFLKPQNLTNDWEKTDLWYTAAKIPGVQVISDPNGDQARLFHATTSGQTVLYGPTGKVLFRGGITSARGHSGDNAGRSAIVSILNQELPAVEETSVFGCPLFDDNSECRVTKDEPRKP
jgi:hypothetical protein